MNALPPLDMEAVVRQALQSKATTDQDTGKPRAGACAATEDRETMKPIEQLVNRFLTWPVPADCHPDGTPGLPGRTGTNLLTAAQAKAMLEHVLAADAAPADALEADIQARASVAPRVTPADIEGEIASEFFFTAADGVLGESHMGTRPAGIARSLNQLTFCVLVLRNGFTVTGESACASPENFDADIGRKVARANAVAKVWPLLDFRLRDKLSASGG